MTPRSLAVVFVALLAMPAAAQTPLAKPGDICIVESDKSIVCPSITEDIAIRVGRAVAEVFEKPDPDWRKVGEAAISAYREAIKEAAKK